MPRRFQHGLTFLVLVIGLVLTLSRESFIAFIVGIVVVALVDRRRQLWRGLALVAVSFTVFGVVNTLDHSAPFHRVESLGPSNHNTAQRLKQQGPSLSYFESSPIFGIGFSRWNDVWNENLHYWRGSGLPHFVWFATGYKPVNDDQQPHNSYLLFGAELGVVGLGLILSFWGLYLLEMLGAFRRYLSGSFEQAYVASAGAIGVFVLVVSLFGNGLSLPSLGLVACFFGGTAVAFAGAGGASESLGRLARMVRIGRRASGRAPASTEPEGAVGR